MKVKVKVLEIKKFSHETADFFAGAYTSLGYSIEIEFQESLNGFFYIANFWRGIPVAGETATINFTQAKSEAEAIYWLQDHVETINVEKIVATTPWFALTKYYSQDWEEFESEEAAKEAAYNPWSGVKEGETTYSEVVFKSEIINLTQHKATAEQLEAGVVEPAEKAAVQAILTFDAIPSVEEIQQRALLLAAIAVQSGCKKAMIGGAPFFMSALESALKAQGIAPVYAFSQRESVESIQSDGSVVKTNMFKHVGFVEVVNGINS